MAVCPSYTLGHHDIRVLSLMAYGCFSASSQSLTSSDDQFAFLYQKQAKLLVCVLFMYVLVEKKFTLIEILKVPIKLKIFEP
jgi:hypothetical protein